MAIFLALVAVPLIEIGLFIQVGGVIGLWATLAVVLATALAGAALLRRQGFAALAELQRRIDAGADPSGTLADGALILVSGILLLTPGFFTDAVGFLLLVPRLRAWAIRLLVPRLAIVTVRTMAARGGAAARGWPPGETVDGAFEEVRPAADRESGPAGPAGPSGLPRR